MSADDDTKGGAERRTFERFPTSISVECSSGENFLFSYITNISEMGIFIRTEEPQPVGTEVSLRFGPEGAEPLELAGEVVWVNPVRADGENLNPGMGIRFSELTLDLRERIVEIVRTVAYLSDDDQAN